MQTVNDRIEFNNEIMMGKPVIKGTRITVQNIVEELAAGYSVDSIIEAHPRLKKDIYAALQDVKEVIKNEKNLHLYPMNFFADEGLNFIGSTTAKGKL